ncbi:MAG: hypothetical protein ACF787_12455, partial [Rhodopirellula sp. JB053]
SRRFVPRRSSSTKETSVELGRSRLSRNFQSRLKNLSELVGESIRPRPRPLNVMSRAYRYKRRPTIAFFVRNPESKIAVFLIARVLLRPADIVPLLPPP